MHRIFKIIFIVLITCSTTALQAQDEIAQSGKEKPMQKIMTFLMFEGKAEEAMNFYTSLFENSKIESITRYKANETGKEGTVKHAVFSLNGQQYMCIDSPAKHEFNFTPSISLYVTCETEEEIDNLFKQLSEGGEVLMPLDQYPFSEKFGWVNDKYGVSWQLSWRLNLINNDQANSDSQSTNTLANTEEQNTQSRDAAKVKLNYSILIDAPREKVWNTMLNDETYRQWTQVFADGSYYEGSWDEGSKILFLAPSSNGKMGLVSKIKENRKYEYISIEHKGTFYNGIEDTTSEQVKAWAGALENYTLKDKDGMTEVIVDMDSNEQEKTMMDNIWPKALEKLKEIVEK